MVSMDKTRRKTVLRVILLALAAGALATLAWALLSPTTSLATSATDDGYAQTFLNQKAGVSDSYGQFMGIMRGGGLKTADDGEVLPGFADIPAFISNLALAFVPVLFVIKFAGRAMISLTQSGSDNPEMSNFFKTAEERKEGPSGGAKDGTSWYVAMAKDFLRYFGVALAVWLIFNGIITVIQFVFNMNGAPSMDAGGFFGQFAKS